VKYTKDGKIKKENKKKERLAKQTIVGKKAAKKKKGSAARIGPEKMQDWEIEKSKKKRKRVLPSPGWGRRKNLFTARIVQGRPQQGNGLGGAKKKAKSRNCA